MNQGRTICFIENAVKTQIWIAVSVYVLVAIMRKRLRLEASLHQILQILSLTLFKKTPQMGIRLTHQTPSAGRKVQPEPQPVGGG